MITIPAALQTHLNSGATTMCHCWRLTRKDAVVQGFTNHDENIVLLGTTFLAASGFTASQINKSLGLSTDNLEVQGALSSASINEDDLALGRYDDAYIELFWVNWADVTQYITQMTGFTGETKRSGVAFTAELRGLSTKIDQTTMRTYKRTCDARLGDNRCKVNLTLPAFNGTATIASILSPRVFTVIGLGAFAAKLFAFGLATFNTGPNAGLILDVKSHTINLAGIVTIELWAAPAFTPSVGNTMAMQVGCDQSIGTCFTVFNNVVNNRSFVKMPGNDTVIKNVDPSAVNEGSSTTTTGKG